MPHLPQQADRGRAERFRGAFRQDPRLVVAAFPLTARAQRHPGDQVRRREIALKPAGQKLVDDSIKTFRQIDADMFEGITDREIDGLTATLEKLYQNLCRMENA